MKFPGLTLPSDMCTLNTTRFSYIDVEKVEAVQLVIFIYDYENMYIRHKVLLICGTCWLCRSRWVWLGGLYMFGTILNRLIKIGCKTTSNFWEFLNNSLSYLHTGFLYRRRWGVQWRKIGLVKKIACTMLYWKFHHFHLITGRNRKRKFLPQIHWSVLSPFKLQNG